MSNYVNDRAHNALNRMARAHARGTGCHLTAEMIEGLGRTSWGETWAEADPRDGKFYGAKAASNPIAEESER